MREPVRRSFVTDLPEFRHLFIRQPVGSVNRATGIKPPNDIDDILNNAAGRLFEYRTARVNGVLQWVLRPVYTLAYYVQRFIRRSRAASDFRYIGYPASGPGHTDPDRQNSAPYLVNLINHFPFNP